MLVIITSDRYRSIRLCPLMRSLCGHRRRSVWISHLVLVVFLICVKVLGSLSYPGLYLFSCFVCIRHNKNYYWFIAGCSSLVSQSKNATASGCSTGNTIGSAVVLSSHLLWIVNCIYCISIGSGSCISSVGSGYYYSIYLSAIINVAAHPFGSSLLSSVIMACQTDNQGSGRSFATVDLGNAFLPFLCMPTAVITESSQ